MALRHGCSPVSLLHIFRTPFPKNTSGRLLLRDHLPPKDYITELSYGGQKMHLTISCQGSYKVHKWAAPSGNIMSRVNNIKTILIL